ncbi:MAG: SidA/IucD/PvdA family monooxygenase, partial [Brevibacterium aurantiacum]|nr:SidA/IucD/PvdA family monooxygenase [Brevibacterium aurantiacum]
RFFPMEYTKLTLEMTSPEYTDHFRALPDDLRELLGREQRTLYKGISAELVDDIHDTLYRLSRGGRKLRTNLLAESELISAERDVSTGDYALRFRNTALDKSFDRRSGSVVSATGYKSQVPDFLAPLGDEIRLDAKGRLDVSRHYTVNDAGTIHVLNGEEHTHGVTAPDLGFGPWRASVVLSHVTGREPYPIEKTIAFQTFGIPDDGADDDGVLDDGALESAAEEGTAPLSTRDDFESHFDFADSDADSEPHSDSDSRAAEDREMTHV